MLIKSAFIESVKLNEYFLADLIKETARFLTTQDVTKKTSLSNTI